jgi:hypothetical protein
MRRLTGGQATIKEVLGIMGGRRKTQKFLDP